MKFRVVVEYDRKTKSYAVYCLELPGFASAADTRALALTSIKEAIALYLEPSRLTTLAKATVYEVEMAA